MTVTSDSDHERESESRPSHWRLDSTARGQSWCDTVTAHGVARGLAGRAARTVLCLFLQLLRSRADGVRAAEYCGSPGSLAVAASNHAGI